MEILVTEGAVLPPGCIVSVRAGSTRRQGPLESLSGQPLKFPSNVDFLSESLKIDVYQPVASTRLVLQADCSEYRIPLDKNGAPPGMTLRLNINRNPGQSQQTGEAGDAKMPDVPGVVKHQDSAASAKVYLEKFGLLHFVQAMLHAVIAEKPEDPFEYMMEQLASAVRTTGMTEPPTDGAPARQPAAPAEPSLGKNPRRRLSQPKANATAEAVEVPGSLSPPPSTSEPKAAPPAECEPEAEEDSDPKPHADPGEVAEMGPSAANAANTTEEPAEVAAEPAPQASHPEPDETAPAAEHEPDPTIPTDSAREGEAEAENADEVVERLRREMEVDIGGRTVVSIVAGSKYEIASNLDVARALGRALATDLGPSVVFATGGLGELQRAVAEGFEGDAEARLFHLIGGGAVRSDFSRGKDLRSAANDSVHRAVRGRVAGVMITIEGGVGTVAETTAAAERGAKIIPLIRTGGASAGHHGMLPELLSRPEWATEAEWAALGDTAVDVAEYAASVVALVRAADDSRLSPLPPPKPDDMPPPPPAEPPLLPPASVEAKAPTPEAPAQPDESLLRRHQAEAFRVQLRQLLLSAACDGKLVRAVQLALDSTDFGVQVGQGLLSAESDGRLASTVEVVLDPTSGAASHAETTHEVADEAQSLRVQLRQLLLSAACEGTLGSALQAVFDPRDVRAQLHQGLLSAESDGRLASVVEAVFDTSAQCASHAEGGHKVAVDSVAAAGVAQPLDAGTVDPPDGQVAGESAGDVQPSSIRMQLRHRLLDAVENGYLDASIGVLRAATAGAVGGITSDEQAMPPPPAAVASRVSALKMHLAQALERAHATGELTEFIRNAGALNREQRAVETEEEADLMAQEEVEHLRASLANITSVSAELRGTVQGLAGILEELQNRTNRLHELATAQQPRPPPQGGYPVP